MEKLQAEQELRLECMIAAFEHYNMLLESECYPIEKTPYQIAEEMYSYVIEGVIPETENLN